MKQSTQAQAKDTDQTTDDATKASGQRANHAILAALIAVFAGVGVVGFAPAEPAQDDFGEVVGAGTLDDVIRVLCPRTISKPFNPRTRTPGRSIARVDFRFSFRTDPVRKARVLQRVEKNWDRIESRVLSVLMEQQPHEIQDSALLESRLAHAIDETVFADGIAHVDEIMFMKILVQ